MATTETYPSPKRALSWPAIGGFALGILGLSLGLAWISSGFQGVTGWLSFTAALVLASGIMLGGWLALKSEKMPGWLGALFIGAALLRLIAGVVWFVAMPQWGHGSLAEQAGYIMADASSRDQAAWEIAESDKPLWVAFKGQRKVDQYGGMLFISAAVYRYLGGITHQPLLMVVFSAAISSLGVLFTWALSRRAWDAKIAGAAAWIYALYPEAVLLGSSQMREAFTMTLTVISFYGLLKYQQERSWTSIAWIVGPIILFAPLSPPFAALLIGSLGLTILITLAAQRREIFQGRWLWVVMGGVIVLVLVGLWVTLKQFTPEGMNNPLAMLNWWLRKSAFLQAYRAKHASGLIQYIFEYTPLWSHMPLLITYGVVQPFLPAAFTVPSQAPIWPWITMVRAVGWTIFLVSLIYAPILAFSKKDKQSFTIALIVVVWLGILVASYRGGGDLWDNPRYRTTFAGLQSALVAWAWINHRREPTPWLRRLLLGTIGFVIWLLPWYIRRYTVFSWPIDNIFMTLGLGFITACVLILWDWFRGRSK
jgi:hypothetical protein